MRAAKPGDTRANHSGNNTERTYFFFLLPLSLNGAGVVTACRPSAIFNVFVFVCVRVHVFTVIKTN